MTVDPTPYFLPPVQQCRLTAEPVVLYPTWFVAQKGDPERGAGQDSLLAFVRRKGFSLATGSGQNASGAMDQVTQVCFEKEKGLPAEGYKLQISGTRIQIAAGDRPGWFYGVQTFLQWLRIHAADTPTPEPRKLPGLDITDFPDFDQRGVMLDISRDKVPTMDTLLQLVDTLAHHKINQFQLYTEHTFAYSGHEEVWSQSGAMTSQQVQQLENFAKERCVQLVANQNSFGHMHRWLVHDTYRPMAECPEGILHPFSIEREPFSLCPLDSRVLPFLGGLYDQLAACYSSKMVNVGLDETFELGQGRSKEACNQQGRHRVYVDFLKSIHQLLETRGKRMQFWCDIILEAPDLIPDLPKDAIGLNWGYAADHPFETQTKKFQASGLDYYVCPGTSSWNSFGGRWDNALQNLASAARAGFAHGSAGYLNTDWGDFGHMQPLCISYLGFSAGAAFAWHSASADRPKDISWPELVDLHWLQAPGAGFGQILQALGNLYQKTGSQFPNGSQLFYLLRFAHADLDQKAFRKLSPEGLAQIIESTAAIADQIHSLETVGAESATTAKELLWVAALMGFMAKLGLARHDAGPTSTMADLARGKRRSLAQELEQLLGSFDQIWLLRNRLGGMGDSRSKMARLKEWLHE